MTSRTVPIVQAKVGSTQLPGKVLPLRLGEPMLTRVMAGALKVVVRCSRALAPNKSPNAGSSTRRRMKAAACSRSGSAHTWQSECGYSPGPTSMS